MTTGILPCCCKGIEFQAHMYTPFGTAGNLIPGVEFVTSIPCGDLGTQFSTPSTCQFSGQDDVTVDVVEGTFPDTIWFVHWLIFYENGEKIRSVERPLSFGLSEGIVKIYAMFFFADEDLPTCEDIRLHVPARIKLTMPPTIPLAGRWQTSEENPDEVYPGPITLQNYQRFTPHPDPDAIVLSCRDRWGVGPPGLIGGGMESVTYRYDNARGVCAIAYISAFWLQHRGGIPLGFTGIASCQFFVTLLDTDGVQHNPDNPGGAGPIARLMYLESFNQITPTFTQEQLTVMTDFCPSAEGGCDLSGFPELSGFQNTCLRGTNHVYPIKIKPTNAETSVVFCDLSQFPNDDTHMLFCDEVATSCP